MIAFLDYDGVLHPDAAYIEKGRPVLRVEGEFFMWAPLLVDVLADHPRVRIVLSTSWVRNLLMNTHAFDPKQIYLRLLGLDKLSKSDNS